MEKYISYKELLLDYQDEKIPYTKLLSTNEWRLFRDAIVNRDNHTCRICNAIETERIGKFYIRKPTEEENLTSIQKHSFLIKDNSLIAPKYAVKTGIIDNNPTILHAHHSYYIHNQLPWEYDKDSIITVCQNCHYNIHQTSIIPTYKDISKTDTLKLTPCEKCYGTGYIEKYFYYENGVCFSCMGNRFIEYCQ